MLAHFIINPRTQMLAVLIFLGFLAFSANAENDKVFYQPAGLYVRLNQKAVDYMSELASQAVPEILNNMSPPLIEVNENVNISNLHISKVTKPEIQAKFIEGRGVRYNISLSNFQASAHASIKFFIFEYEGSFIAELRGLHVVSELLFEFLNHTTHVTAPICNVTHHDLSISMPPDSQLVSIQGEIKGQILSALQGAICTTAVEALTFLMAHKPVQPEHPDYKKPEVSTSTDGFSMAELGASLCESHSAKEEEDKSEEEIESTTTPAPEDLLDVVAENSTAKPFWDVDLSVNHPPTFSDNDMIIGLDGGIMYNGWKAESAHLPHVLNKTALDKGMIGILLSEYIPNTLFHHVFMNDLGSFRHRYGPSSLPKILQKLSKAVCSKCYVEISANLTEQPRLQIDASLGARVQLSGNVSIMFKGREELHDVLHANTKLHVTLKPTIRHSRIFGEVSLTNVDVNVFDLGIGGPLAAPIEKLFSFIVPRVLWPQVKKRLRFAMNRRGIKLPVFCGVELEHTQLDFVDHAVLMNTDFKFDLPLFVRKYKKYLEIKAKRNPNMLKYVLM
ncbi:unnamed protein product [Caenorhabditis angaria]|uniref:Lipid-binding serum glycoprotein C-terminal domain-containing protein n=1 Tax=Caenorhabditis angaria TaxID=860376 RepID=A0A9P1IRQ9_9PELO|nr:unnamed protein product [Caenorhabditis angaria]